MRTTQNPYAECKRRDRQVELGGEWVGLMLTGSVDTIKTSSLKHYLTCINIGVADGARICHAILGEIVTISSSSKPN